MPDGSGGDCSPRRKTAGKGRVTGPLRCPPKWPDKRVCQTSPGDRSVPSAGSLGVALPTFSGKGWMACTECLGFPAARASRMVMSWRKNSRSGYPAAGSLMCVSRPSPTTSIGHAASRVPASIKDAGSSSWLWLPLPCRRTGTY